MLLLAICIFSRSLFFLAFLSVCSNCCSHQSLVCLAPSPVAQPPHFIYIGSVVRAKS